MEGKVLIIRHSEDEGPGRIIEHLELSGIAYKLVKVDQGEDVPENISGFAGAVSLSGLINVYDDNIYPFLKDEFYLIEKLLKGRIPFLGIGLGAQILAKVCGVEIQKDPSVNCGISEIEVTQEGRNSPLLHNLPDCMKVMHRHRDKLDLPIYGITLARKNGNCEAFRIGECAFGLLFHPEATIDTAKKWLKKKEYGQIEDLQEGKEAAKNAETICANFAALAGMEKE